MKKFTLLFLFILFISESQTFAQITITQSDISSFYSTSNTLVSSTAESASVDIGSPGGGNTWDFSSLTADSMATLTSIDPAGTPFVSDFSDANICQHYKLISGDTTIDYYSYNKVGSGEFRMYGSGTMVSTSNQENKLLIAYNPPMLSIKFPVAEGSTWSSSDSMLMSTDLMGSMMVYSRHKIEMTNEVDAYGTVKLPDGSTENALRLRQEHVLISSSFPGLPTTRKKTVDFVFVTKSGQSVTVTTSDTTATSGSITGEVNWSLLENNGTTGISDTKAQASTLSMGQNSPNPFSSQTTINYKVEEAGAINLTIYDISGRRIKTLVKARKPAGTYHVLWDGRNELGAKVKSGFYISRLSSDNETRTIKMLLTK